MKTTFKPLGLVAAVAAASAGYAGIVNAQGPVVPTDDLDPDTGLQLAGNSGLGDMAIVPYYTVNELFSTGVSIINTSDMTQVVKIRLRRAADSMDALDFNVILSPWDVYTGYVQLEGEDVRFYSNDNSCTAPGYSGINPDGPNWFTMPDIYRDGANEGYMEIMAMAAADSSQAISVNAKHSGGVPANCTLVRDNFFAGDTVLDYGAGANTNRRGVIRSDLTHDSTLASSNYVDSGNVLKVSYFLRDEDSGTEFGNDAVHFANFMLGPSMTNQQLGLFDGDLQGFDYPDLNGGAAHGANVDMTDGVAGRGSYEILRSVIGGQNVINDWSANTTDLFSVDTDWVVTAPGQYLMTYLYGYLLSVAAPDSYNCTYGDPALTDETTYDPVVGANCDFRDIPMTATVTVYDREEQGVVIEEGDLVVSPAPPQEIIRDVLDQEVNVIRWSANGVIGAEKSITVPTPAGATAGWANLAVSQNGATIQGICDFDNVAGSPSGQPSPEFLLPVTCTSTDTSVPLVGFVAWQRAFDELPAANYGRIVEHSYAS